jgi:hypothetical protein
LRVAGAFFTSKHSPANQLFPHDLQRHAITHSTGGQLFWTLKQNEAMQDKLHRLFSSEIHIAPYLDSANASRRHSSFFNRLAFDMYSRRHHERKPAETLLGRVYLKLKALGEHFTERPCDLSPTYGQILQVQRAGRNLTDTFNPQACRCTPCDIVLGDRDPFACHKTGAEFAARVGAQLHVVKGGGHSPLNTAPDILDLLVNRIAAQTRPYVDTRAQKENPAPVWMGLEGSVNFESALGFMDRLSYRAGIALERCARFLDTAASFLEGFFRGGVGNAEVRREPERYALNSGYAFGFQQIRHKVAVGLYHLAVGGAFANATGTGRIDVESPLGLRTADSIGVIQHAYNQIPTSLERFDPVL